MKLSVVIICWNDLKVISNCLRSIFAGTRSIDFEVIVSDNGSTDGSIEFIRQNYPAVRVIENRANLGFAKGNNVGITASRGEYVLILNPDTIIHDGTLDKWVAFADRHPEAGAFGCRVLNLDGSYQESARPFPTIRGDWIAALYLRPLAYISDVFIPDAYTGWKGDTERVVDWQSGCCVMFRGELLKRVGGFDEQFFYHYEEVDLCRRVWNAGYPLLFTPEVTITHLGGQSVGRFPIRFALETYRSRYRYFYKHYGAAGARRCRRVAMASVRIRRFGYGLVKLVKPTEAIQRRLEMYRVLIRWNRELDPVRFVERGEEPKINSIHALQNS
ncbi:MAG TPA: glycosyltransferase family 2 protein [Terriglobia bacterium]|nr:glycosyltransferase family 2 protein [Terriglobia bacterium]